MIKNTINVSGLVPTTHKPLDQFGIFYVFKVVLVAPFSRWRWVWYAEGISYLERKEGGEDTLFSDQAAEVWNGKQNVVYLREPFPQYKRLPMGLLGVTTISIYK